MLIIAGVSAKSLKFLDDVGVDRLEEGGNRLRRVLTWKRDDVGGEEKLLIYCSIGSSPREGGLAADAGVDSLLLSERARLASPGWLRSLVVDSEG